jgi:hypothetical protein
MEVLNMTIEIKRTKIKSCDICGDEEVPQIPDPDADPSNELVEMVDDPNWEGEVGYHIREEEPGNWRRVSLCAKCMTKVMKGMNLINVNKLTKIAL